jgi:hypothetical protein
MTISSKTTKMLWGRAAALCSMPTCRMHLVLDETETDDEALIGEMCHMVAESEDGPRGESPLTREQRDFYANLILLCRNHHGEIDKQPEAYPVGRLQEMKRAHETWVRSSFPDYDRDKQRDEEIYAGYIDEWAERCRLAEWRNWSSGVLFGGQPRLSAEMDGSLEELRRWLLVRVWPGRYPELEDVFGNFRLVLRDFQETFRKHAERPYPEADFLLTPKFYQIEDWDEEKYARLGRQYDYHVDLVQDLMLELTRAANLVCDEVRATLQSSYGLKEGRLSVQSGPHDGFGWREMVVQYSAAERAISLPYPGLSCFLTERSNRDVHFGRGERN